MTYSEFDWDNEYEYEYAEETYDDLTDADYGCGDIHFDSNPAFNERYPLVSQLKISSNKTCYSDVNGNDVGIASSLGKI